MSVTFQECCQNQSYGLSVDWASWLPYTGEAMQFQCPVCSSKYSLKDGAFANRSSVTGQCPNCGNTLVITAAGAVSATGSKPVPSPAAPPSPSNAGAQATVISSSRTAIQLPHNKTVSLSATSGPFTGQVFRLSKPQVVIGRVGTDIVVADPEVSRKHCALEIHGRSALLVDLGSSNGTYVGDERITQCELQHLSEFRIGNSTLLLTFIAME